MKRVTSWPQAVLGLAFSWGALIGWSATFASLALAPALLYLSAFAWTIGYDTIYAMQDARDDAIVGIRSTARLFGENTRLGVGLFYVAAALAGAGGHPPRWRRPNRADRLACLCGPFGLAGLEVEGADAATALRLFRSNRDAGFLLFAGIALQGWAG